MRIDKHALRSALAETIDAELATLLAAQRLTSEGVTHDDARAEGSKDTRATEASYLARGQAERVAALAADLARVKAMTLRRFDDGDAIALSALIRVVNDDGKERVLFLAPAGGGTTISEGGVDVDVITPRSPLGKILVGAGAGDIITWERGEQVQEFDVLEVR